MDPDFENDLDDFDMRSDNSFEDSTNISDNKIHGKYPFLKDHPLYETHQVNISKFIDLIPNFVGGSLPRCRGDGEYYCTTMLTLFKPQRCRGGPQKW
jgi:hypothetical protein